MGQNQEIIKQPTKDEVKQAVYGLNGESARGHNGINGFFVQAGWDIIGDDVFDMVKDFFNDRGLPRFVTHTNLVLLPKKKEVTTFSDMRPIILSNFINKVFSRVIHERLVDLLPNLISDEQAGFVKGRSIVENIILIQKIITDIRLRIKTRPNIVIKIDMTEVESVERPLAMDVEALANRFVRCSVTLANQEAHKRGGAGSWVTTSAKVVVQRQMHRSEDREPQMRTRKRKKGTVKAVKKEAGRGLRCEVLSAPACPQMWVLDRRSAWALGEATSQKRVRRS
uniref:Reverse transcriptase domain-containing protein n=1 Tax=Nicotiana tabacum TaxID=4097 RepID=A0A1S4BEF3_TOBAC|nr:PREDICTED: uncharacterized protein LOC107807374 [Nicotiana tabacum]